MKVSSEIGTGLGGAKGKHTWGYTYMGLGRYIYTYIYIGLDRV